MEEREKEFSILNYLPQPAFCVREGMIICTNDAAERRMVCAGTPIDGLLLYGKEEYASFSSGELHLTLQISARPCGATVTREADFDLFRLDQEDDAAQFRAMALAAQELRGPLTNIMTVTERLFPVSGIDESPDTLLQVSHINRGLFQMLRIISNMSDAGNAGNSMDSNQDVHDLTRVMQEIFEKAQALVEHLEIQLSFTNLSEPVYTQAHPEKLERAIFNMISNSVKFTPKGGHIDATLTRRGRMLRLTVQDSGSGVPDRLRSSVYTRYNREPGVEDSRHGIGLGMVLIRSAAAAHGGTVLIEQPENEGMRITMTMAIRPGSSSKLRSAGLRIDYSGERDHGLLELSETLPASLYAKQ